MDQITMIVMVIILMQISMKEIVFDLPNFLLGIVASFICWLIINVILSPRLKISSKIACRNIYDQQKDNRKLFQIKITNKSRIRDVYDIDVRIRYHLSKDSYYSGGLSHISLLKPRPFFLKKPINNKRTPFYSILNIKGFKDKNGSTTSIDDFFKVGNNEWIDIFAIGYDRFTGSTRHLKTVRYYMHDIEVNSYFEENEDDPVSLPSDDRNVHNVIYDNHNQTDI